MPKRTDIKKARRRNSTMLVPRPAWRCGKRATM